MLGASRVAAQVPGVPRLSERRILPVVGHRSGGQRPLGLRRLDLDHLAEAMDGFNRVIERDRPLRWNQLGDLQVVAAAFGPDEGRYAKHAAAHRLLMLARQGREIGRFEISFPARGSGRGPRLRLETPVTLWPSNRAPRPAALHAPRAPRGSGSARRSETGAGSDRLSRPRPA